MFQIIFRDLKNTNIDIIKNLLLAPVGAMIIIIHVVMLWAIFQILLGQILSLIFTFFSFSLIIFAVYLIFIFPFLLFIQLILNHFKIFSLFSIALFCIVLTLAFAYIMFGLSDNLEKSFQTNLFLISFFSVPTAIANGYLAYQAYLKQESRQIRSFIKNRKY
ncbi:hypothetical protein [Acinetobacter gerneri]|uniref:hypothetical protein n=1 Tax=Acinetobacter gerneri TaxID=202952 RepID=UPI00321604E6